MTTIYVETNEFKGAVDFIDDNNKLAESLIEWDEFFNSRVRIFVGCEDNVILRKGYEDCAKLMLNSKFHELSCDQKYEVARVTANYNVKLKLRAEMVKAMDLIARSIDDKNISTSWLESGVADVHVDDSTKDKDLSCYCKDKEFSQLMTLFLKLMSRAKESGGLYCDGITSE